MDGREAISSYFLHHHRAIGSQPGLHAPSGFRQIDHSPSLPVHSIGGSATIGPGFQIESSSAIVSTNSHGINAGPRLAGLGSSGEPVKRKRGRPRKYGPDGTVSLPLALSSTSSTPPGLSSGMGTETGSGSGYGSGLQMQKRGRGRPPGTGRKQLLASLGEWISGSAGMGFTPHVILIPVGEDIAAKIMSFSQQGPRAVCILSANGAVSTVTLRQPASSGGTVTYEDRFEILSMTGSFLLTDDGGSRSRSGGLSICLSDPNGRVIGGGVAGLLMAASPVQVIVGSFMYGGTAKSKNKLKTGEETGAKSEPLAKDQEGTQSITLPNQGFGSSLLMGGWPRNPNVGIDLTQ